MIRIFGKLDCERKLAMHGGVFRDLVRCWNMVVITAFDPSYVASVLFHFLQSTVQHGFRLEFILPTSVIGYTKWSTPPSSMLKLNVDGALFKDQGFGGLGAIIRNHEGRELYCLSKLIPLSVDVEFLEGRCLPERLKMGSFYWH
ncbi:conserved hypothetical protein [Ricinus communis]|uniref:RNase H type-1 domain-containing protein n=1 Tax=Ricinus communis TaxID=3988 RepID=B9STP0_RICCO|nr:conserved hypothetical protein [Ricinus communis]